MRGILFSALAIGAAALPIDTITAALVNGDRNRVWNETSNTLIDRPFRSERGVNKDEAWLYGGQTSAQVQHASDRWLRRCPSTTSRKR